MSEIFYRVGNLKQRNRGLWYSSQGKFTGDIHTKYDFCTHKDLQMPYDENIVGFLSAVTTLDELKKWFTPDDMKKLKPYGFRILEYKAFDFKQYNDHYLIDEKTSIILSSDIKY
jgi:hypothetical protein